MNIHHKIHYGLIALILLLGLLFWRDYYRITHPSLPVKDFVPHLDNQRFHTPAPVVHPLGWKE